MTCYVINTRPYCTHNDVQVSIRRFANILFTLLLQRQDLVTLVTSPVTPHRPASHRTSAPPTEENSFVGSLANDVLRPLFDDRPFIFRYSEMACSRNACISAARRNPTTGASDCLPLLFLFLPLFAPAMRLANICACLFPAPLLPGCSGLVPAAAPDSSAPRTCRRSPNQLQHRK